MDTRAQEVQPVQPEVRSHRGRAVGAGLAVAAALGFGGAYVADTWNDGNDGDASVESVVDSTVPTSEAVTTTTTFELILPGDDATIAAEAANTRCGQNSGVWSPNTEPSILSKPENRDLLDSKMQNLYLKGGVNAINYIIDSAAVVPAVDVAFTTSDDAYIRLLAKLVPVQMTDEAAARFPARENYTCPDIDNDGVGDSSVYRDARANKNNGVNVTLAAATLSVEDWNQAIALAYADKIDLANTLLWQKETIEVTENGQKVMKEVIRVFLEDDSCGNQVFVSTPPEMPPMIVTTTVETPDTPNTTTPNTGTTPSTTPTQTTVVTATTIPVTQPPQTVVEYPTKATGSDQTLPGQGSGQGEHPTEPATPDNGEQNPVGGVINLPTTTVKPVESTAPTTTAAPATPNSQPVDTMPVIIAG